MPYWIYLIALEQSKVLGSRRPENKIIEKEFYISAGFDDYPLAMRVALEKATATKVSVDVFLISLVSNGARVIQGRKREESQGGTVAASYCSILR
jgi:hypothetical protein